MTLYAKWMAIDIDNAEFEFEKLTKKQDQTVAIQKENISNNVKIAS